MPKKVVTVKFSIIKESKNRTTDELLKEISEAFSRDEFIIPWIDKVEDISITEI